MAKGRGDPKIITMLENHHHAGKGGSEGIVVRSLAALCTVLTLIEGNPFRVTSRLDIGKASLSRCGRSETRRSDMAMLRALACLACLLGGIMARADDPLLSIEVKAVAKDAKPIERKYPKHYIDFEKRIKELDGKPVLDLLGKKLSIRLLNNSARLGKKTEPYTGTDFTCAILRGRIISDGKMAYHLQDSEECLVTTAAGDFKVGIFYRPIGYVVLPNSESYWFLFENEPR
jgi:hypothetical protein